MKAEERQEQISATIASVLIAIISDSEKTESPAETETQEGGAS